MRHTEEPWRVGNGYGSVVSDAQVRGGPMGADDVKSYGGYLICESATKANATRIVACINACAGLSEGEIKAAIKDWKAKRRNIVL